MNTADIPLFPLNVVLFPGGLLPLRIFEARYMDMAKACLRDGAPFGVCLIREGREVGDPARPEDVGCLARIVDWDMQQLGLLLVTAQGETRFRILERRVEPDGLARARVALLPGDTDAPLPQASAVCAAVLRSVIERHGSGVFAQPHRFESASWVGARLAEVLPLPLTARQQMLELDDALERIGMLQRYLAQLAESKPGSP